MTHTGSIIEELTIEIDPLVRSAYVARDADVWTPFLQSCDGFLGKEVWLPDDRPGVVVMVIRWATRAHWKAIGPDQVAAVDRGMGDLFTDSISCRSYQVA